MIEQLIDAFHAKELSPTAEEIADLFWLAQQMGEPTYRQAAAFARHNAQLQSEDDIGGDEPWDDKDRQPDRSQIDTPQDTRPFGADVQLPPDSDEDEDVSDRSGGLPFYSPGSTALPGALDVARALRHLKRLVPSRTQFLLDEEATVRHIVDTGDWSPVQKPAFTLVRCRVGDRRIYLNGGVGAAYHRISPIVRTTRCVSHGSLLVHGY
ncbi:MAG: hypothetical protein R2932_40790 [Caldilineaceae bacterium]